MRYKNIYWVALFSRTGQEIVELSKKLKRYPDMVITNAIEEDIVPKLLKIASKQSIDYVRLKDRPTAEEYFSILPINKPKLIITLHGWLRIIPKEVCEFFKGRLFNGHPGLITVYPELKGFNPQKKAFDLHLPVSGSVVHEVSPEVDEGRIVSTAEIPIAGLSLDEVYSALRKTSLDAWSSFLNSYLGLQR
jgi:folate-dependent phosphoribosylglycinamide formyltransferase PurN